MKVLFVVSECIPFASTGGLGEVSYSLPRALKQLGTDCSVIMPLYDVVFKKYQAQLQYLETAEVKIGWQKQMYKLYILNYQGINYYFIDNEYYFHRENLYSYFDDGERFVFFSESVVALLQKNFFAFDIIHCHDHHSAFVIAKLAITNYSSKLIFTIHNITYQGNYPLSFFDNCLGVEKKYQKIFEYNHEINMMKAGIVTSNLTTTVSPRYAKELKHRYFACGLANIINAYQDKIIGIINGIDYQYYNSDEDSELYCQYNLETINLKKENKYYLQKKLGLPKSNKPMISIISRLVEHKGIDLIIEKFNQLLNLDINLIILGKGETRYQNFFANVNSPNFRYLENFESTLAKQIYAGSDFILMPSKYEPCGLSQMIACRYGTIPIVRKTGGLTNTINDQNGYLFNRFDSQEMFKTIEKAIITYNNNYKLHLQKITKAIKSDFSWNLSAKSYLNLYRSLL